MSEISPFAITAGDFDAEETEAKKAQPVKKKPRFQALNDDMIWIAEEDIRRTKKTMQGRDGPMTDREHARFIKTAEQLRKLRLTDAELNKIQDTGDLEMPELDDEFNDRCRERGLDPQAVLEVFGLA